MHLSFTSTRQNTNGRLKANGKFWEGSLARKLLIDFYLLNMFLIYAVFANISHSFNAGASATHGKTYRMQTLFVQTYLCLSLIASRFLKPGNIAPGDAMNSKTSSYALRKPTNAMLEQLLIQVTVRPCQMNTFRYVKRKIVILPAMNSLCVRCQ